MRDNTYDVGDVVTMSIQIVDEEGVAVDPTYLICRVMKPDGAFDDYLVDALTHDSTGEYHIDYLPAVRGTYEYLWLSRGNVYAAEEKKFIIRRPRVTRPA
jgi:hypothetical protein